MPVIHLRQAARIRAQRPPLPLTGALLSLVLSLSLAICQETPPCIDIARHETLKDSRHMLKH